MLIPRVGLRPWQPDAESEEEPHQRSLERTASADAAGVVDAAGGRGGGFNKRIWLDYQNDVKVSDVRLARQRRV